MTIRRIEYALVRDCQPDGRNPRCHVSWPHIGEWYWCILFDADATVFSSPDEMRKAYARLSYAERGRICKAMIVTKDKLRIDLGGKRGEIEVEVRCDVSFRSATSRANKEPGGA